MCPLVRPPDHIFTALAQNPSMPGILGIKRSVAAPLITAPLPFITFAYWWAGRQPLATLDMRMHAMFRMHVHERMHVGSGGPARKPVRAPYLCSLMPAQVCLHLPVPACHAPTCAAPCCAPLCCAARWVCREMFRRPQEALALSDAATLDAQDREQVGLHPLYTHSIAT